jgi:uncharacterized membrane protein YfcA
LIPLGLVGGFVDATGGGGWGPVTTPALLTDGRLAPNRVIGTVSASEFAVAVAASLGFLVGVGASGVRFDYVVALLLGGMIASPIAAYLVRHLNSRFLGVIVGGFICFTNARILLIAAGVTGDGFLATYLIIIGAWITAVAIVLRRLRSEQESSAA